MDNSTYKILVVDDSKADGTYIRHCVLEGFKDFPVNLAQALSYEDALALTDKDRFDILLVDYRLGEKNGIELLEELRRRKINTPAIFLTAYSDFSLVVKAMKAGALDYLVKGKFTEELLCQSLRYAFRLGAREREKNEIEEKLRDSEEQLRKVLEAVKVGISLGTQGGEFKLFNREMERLTGYKLGEADACGDFLEGLCFDEKELKKLQDSFQNVLAGGKDQSLELKIRRKDGAARDMEVSVTTISHQGQQMLLCAYYDVTDQKWSERKLKESICYQLQSEQKLMQTLSDLQKAHEELKASQSQLIQAEKWESVGRLAAGVAHEVKNPLAILQQAMDYLEESLPKDDVELAGLMETMNDAVRRADTTIRGLLDFSRATAITLEAQDLHEIIESCLALAKHEFEKFSIEVVRDFFQEPVLFDGDRLKIEQVFVNLFINAAHAMNGKGTLSIRTRLEPHGDGKDVVVWIEDTGPGIAPENLKKIFEPFFTTKLNMGGTGLGLPIVKSIIEMHRGNILIENRKEGGARVVLWFPQKNMNMGG